MKHGVEENKNGVLIEAL